MSASLSANLPLAHAFGERVELPIPLIAFVLGGAAVVAVSFVAVRPTKVGNRAEEPRDTTQVRPVSMLAGVIGVAVQSVWETGLRMPANALLFAVVAAIALYERGDRRTVGR